MSLKFLRIIFFLFCLVELNINLSAQVEEDRVKASMLYYISDFIIWPEIDTCTTFNIGVIGDRPILIDELNLIAASNEIKNKPIKIVVLDDKVVKKYLHLVFIDIPHYNQIDDYLEICKANHILMVTDQLENKLNTVVNFIKKPDSQNVSFEVNKQNLILSKLDYVDDLLLHGGDMLDVKDLYHETQALLEKEEKKVTVLQQDIENINEELESKNKAIDSLSKNIVQSQNILRALTDTISAQNTEISEQIALIKKQNNRVATINYEIATAMELQQEQENKIRDKEKKLTELEDNIKSKESIIQQQTKTLNVKESIIKSKNRILFLLVIIGLSFLFIGIMVFRAYRMKHRYNEELRITLNHLKETQSQLLQSEKMASIGILTSGIAHEINNPLNFIYGGSKGIENYFKKNLVEHLPKVEILLKSIDEGVRRVSNIVNGLNEFSRTNESMDESCNIHSIIENCLVVLNNQLRHRIDVRKKFTNDVPIIKGNTGQLHQAFINIFSNAEQAIPEKGNITIETSAYEENIEIKISDNGIGISEENIDKIMTPFFTTKDPGKGTGLGMSITYNIIKDHHGQINYLSELNKGTTVTINLPKHKNAVV